MDNKITRRGVLKKGATLLGAATLANCVGIDNLYAAPESRSQVFFTNDISTKGLLKVYEKINTVLAGKTAIKLHTGEPNGPNLLPLELIKSLQPKIANSSIVECNVLYGSPRQQTATHREVLKTNGFNFCTVDIMDSDGDYDLPIDGMAEFLKSNPKSYTKGEHLTSVAVGKNFMNYDSMLVYTHFKGHAMGGFGGSLKNISIGCASGKVGKQQIHGEGWPTGKLFLERMVEAGKGMVDHFANRIAYINVLKNISVDCDCDAHGAKPTCRDIGIMASLDILAIDQASIDMVYAQSDKDKKDIVERIESRSGLHQLTYMKTLNMGNNKYQLIEV